MNRAPNSTANNSPETARKRLLDRQRALENQATKHAGTRRSSQDTVKLDQTRVGRLSRMDAMQQQAMAKATNARTELELVRIRSALQRRDD